MNRKFMLSAIICLAFISVSAQQFSVTLFDQCNYMGRRYTLQAGSYRLYQMQIGNDKLSSMQIPAGMKVTIYQDDKFEGKSKTFTDDQMCLDGEWRNTTSSLVVENTAIPSGFTQNDYVTFYADCYSKGYSQSLRPGSYTGAQLGNLKYNISSMYISGNVRVKAYMNSENLSGYNVILDATQACLPGNQNDKIGSLVIEARPAGSNIGNNNGGYNSNDTYATFYQDCNFSGNALRLAPGFYQGEKLGLMKYNISSIEVPNGMRVKVYLGDENLNGQSYTVNASENCLNSNMRYRIGSVSVERTGFGNNYNNNNNPVSGNYAILYEDEDYRGRSASLLPGSYATMQQAGFTDKSLSSLNIPAGWRVIIYEEENFGGRSYTITSSKTGFGFNGWNDRASSIVVYRN
jgi:hypothetical protein